MMLHPFFPGPAFAWVYCVVLVGITLLATYVDLRSLTIPKPLTLAALGLGIVFNLCRGAWMSLGEPAQGVWALAAHGPLVGAFDGLLFSSAGFLVGFGLFLVMWVLGTCGGGDVKLFAALGAWVGPVLVVFVLAGTLVFVILLSGLRLATGLFHRGIRPTVRDYSMSQAATKGKRAGKQGFADAKKTRGRLMAYSLPVALSTTFVLLWVFRGELMLAPPADGSTSGWSTAVRP